MKTKLTKLAAGVVLSLGAMSMLPTAAQATVISQAILDIQDLSFRVADGADGRSTTFFNPIDFDSVSGSQTGDVNTNLNAGPALTNSFTINLANPADLFAPANQVLAVCEGSCATYSPDGLDDLAPLPATETFTYSRASLVGNALNDTVDVSVDNTVSLVGNHVGTSQSNVNLGVTFDFTLATGIAGLEIYFDATRIFNRLIDQAGEFATSGLEWSFLLQNTSGTVAEWRPNSTVIGGTQRQGSFSLNQTESTVNNPIFNNAQNDSGTFEFETNQLDAGFYQLTLALKSSADGGSVAAVPEPTTLALIGLGLLGLGAASKRRKV